MLSSSTNSDEPSSQLYNDFSQIIEDYTRATKNEIHNLISSFRQYIVFSLELIPREINTFLQELPEKDLTPVGCQFCFHTEAEHHH